MCILHTGFDFPKVESKARRKSMFPRGDQWVLVTGLSLPLLVYSLVSDGVASGRSGDVAIGRSQFLL